MIIFLVVLLIFIFILISKIKLDINFSIINFRYNYKIDIIWFVRIKTLFKENQKLVKNKNELSSKKKIKPWEIIKNFNFEKFDLKIKIGLGNVFRNDICSSNYYNNNFNIC